MIMFEKQDKVLIIIVSLLSLLGILMVLSVSSFSEIQHQSLTLAKFLKQLIWIIIGFVLMFFVSNIHYRVLQNISKTLLLVSLAVLLLVLFAGSAIQGARRWFDFGFMHFQPTTFAMIAVVIYMADRLSRKRHDLLIYKKGLLPFIIILIPFVVLIILQPDYSSALILVMVTFIVLFLSPIPMWHLIVTGMLSFLPLAGAIFLAPYRLERLKVFGLQGAQLKYSQVGHALIALGSGGFFGEGYAASKMKLFFLQAADTDFIVAILGEELGFIGITILLFLFLLLFWRGLRIVSRSQDMFQYYLGAGLVSILFVHFAINMGVVLKIFPTTGIPLPFVSYGGSHILAEFLIIGILLNLSRYQSKSQLRPKENKNMVGYATRKKNSRRRKSIYAVRKY